MNLYWGGSERRITGLTLRIIAVNAIALVILLVGILYLGQYQNNLIEAKLETFRVETQLLSSAISQAAITTGDSGDSETPYLFNREMANSMVRTMSETMHKRIRLFDRNGELALDTLDKEQSYNENYYTTEPIDHSLYSIQILKKISAFIIDALPDKRRLQLYQEGNITNARDSFDARDAMRGIMSLSAWLNEDDRILLSSATPIVKDEQIAGVILITHIARDIEDGIINVWFDIFRGFAITLCITVLLSIYLSGAIARPLKKLAKAAENIRSGIADDTQIPNFSARNDEIGELSLVLRDMTQSLRQRMDSIERFAADVAHELKNPLTSLKSAIETAAIVKKPEDREKLMNIIQHDIERLDRLITDISHASRLDSELSREIFTPVNISALLLNIADRYQSPLEREKNKHITYNNSIKTKEGIHIQVNIEDHENALIAPGSEMKLGQVFVNLLANALSFSKEGNIIVIDAFQRLNAIVITIEDEGPGIPENKLEAIFERFYTERPSHEDYGRHSGLGLSICKQIVKAHKGRIFAENRKDVHGRILGAKFTVILRKIS